MDSLIIKEPSPFWSYLDEENFFRWLESIPAIKSSTGSKNGLELMLDTPLDDANLFDLIAIMHRYGIDKKCLKRFLTDENREWFKDQKAYWYGSIFE